MKYMRGKSEEANHNESCMGLAGIDYLGIERVLKRGTGDILERQDRAILVHDRVSGALMLGCEDAEAGAGLLERHMNGGRRLIMVSDHALGLAACQQYGFTGMLECYQTAWYGDSPCESDSLALKNAEESDHLRPGEPGGASTNCKTQKAPAGPRQGQPGRVYRRTSGGKHGAAVRIPGVSQARICRCAREGNDRPDSERGLHPLRPGGEGQSCVAGTSEKNRHDGFR